MSLGETSNNEKKKAAIKNVSSIIEHASSYRTYSFIVYILH